MTDSKPIQSVAILGGGTAGYIAALYLKKSFPDLAVTLIESSRIPVIGVGEATTPPMLDFLHTLMGFPIDEFVTQARPTLKLGIQFLWGTPQAHHFNSPFGVGDVTAAVRHTGDHNNISLLSMLMEQHKTPFLNRHQNLDEIKLQKPIAYHVDNKYFLRYLREKLSLLQCIYIDTQIKHAALAPDGKSITHLLSTDGTTYKFDLYLDCSGFISFLLGKALQTPWVDYSASLFTNRAILGRRENPGEILPHTTAATLNHGWLWNTPMQHEDHLGYVFSSQHVSDDEAFAELKQHCQSINHERIVTFKPGRHQNSWVGNVIALGNAFAFIEPLESTGIHMILHQLASLTRRLARGPITPQAIDTYNHNTNSRWDSLKFFIALHFRFNHKLDTPFWQRCRNEADVSGLQPYIDHFQTHGPLSNDPENPLHQTVDSDQLFSVFAHDAIMAGCGVNHTFFSPRPAGPAWSRRFAMRQALVAQAVGHRRALAHIATHGMAFRPDVPPI